MHAVLSADALPLLGDTTSNQALLFSPPFGTSPDPEPTFPNYTFPQANASIPPAPTPSPRHTPLLFRTADAPGSAFPITGCALTSAAGQANVGDAQSQDFWRRDTGEWREEWLVGALAPLTNYTAYVIVNDTKVSGPINFVTKSGTPIPRLEPLPGIDDDVLPSIVLLPARAPPPILPQRRLGHPARTAALPSRSARCIIPPPCDDQPDARIPDELHHRTRHLPLRPRRLLAAADLHRLPGRVPPMAVRRPAPAVLRSAVRVPFVFHAATCVCDAGRRRSRAQRESAATTGAVGRASPLPRDLPCRRPRLPDVPRVQVSRAAVQRERKLWSRLCGWGWGG